MATFCFPWAFCWASLDTKIYKISKLIGTKFIKNEFVAYLALSSPEYHSLSKRGAMLVTYALCGFANLGSLGIQVGVLGRLAPSRAGDISRVAISALITGGIATLLSACMAGMVLADMTKFATPSEAVATGTVG